MMFFVHLISLFIPLVVGINIVLGGFLGVYILKYGQIVGFEKKRGGEWVRKYDGWFSRCLSVIFFIDLLFYVSKLPRFLLHPPHDWPRFTGDLLLHNIVYNIGHKQGVTLQLGWLYSQVH